MCFLGLQLFQLSISLVPEFDNLKNLHVTSLKCKYQTTVFVSQGVNGERYFSVFVTEMRLAENRFDENIPLPIMPGRI